MPLVSLGLIFRVSVGPVELDGPTLGEAGCKELYSEAINEILVQNRSVCWKEKDVVQQQSLRHQNKTFCSDTELSSFVNS